MILLLLLRWVYNLVAPIIFIVGMLVLCDGEYIGDNDILIGSLLSVPGFLFGLFTAGLDIAPKLLWIKSALFIFQTRVWNAIEGALVFFLTPCFISGLEAFIEACQDKF